jgi:hypothetical protein
MYFFYHSKEIIYVFSESSNIWISQTLYVWLVFTTQLGSLYNFSVTMGVCGSLEILFLYHRWMVSLPYVYLRWRPNYL